jgi:diguanylate cyclase (GGDEF)-like protein/PAS domain S-box-containing protein
MICSTAQAEPPVRVGVLAFCPQLQAQAQWQPLAQALKKAIPTRDFEVLAYDLKGLELAVANRQVDFVLTNPGHYVLLTRRFGVQAPLATLVNEVEGEESSAFGGVIFTRAGVSKINSLVDLVGRSVVASSPDSLGSYQVQAYELLKAGVDVGRQTQLSFTGMPQDRVVEAVLKGQADVGFVRTGLLEEMVREGKFDVSALRVLNAKKSPGFALQVSTALYPEWPISYLSHVDLDLARHVSAALFLMHEDEALMRQLGIRGFSVPLDYTLVVDTLRDLRVPPFDNLPLFTWRDVAQQYRGELIGAIAALSLILLLGVRLLRTSRRLRSERNTVLLQKASLQESELRWKLAVHASGGGMWDWDVPAHKLYVSDNWKAALGYAAVEIMDSPDEWKNRLHPDDRDAALAALKDCLTGRTEFYLCENRIRCKNGHYKWMQERGQVVSRDADGLALRVIGLDNDITEHKDAQQQLQLAASVFEHAREGIIISDAQGAILDVNQAFTDITGYSKSEVLGENALLLNTPHADSRLFATVMTALQTQDHWFGETWRRRKNGETYAEMLTVSAVRNPGGQLTLCVVMFFDITATKAHQAQLERLAHFDALTNLPNRVFLADRLKHAMAQSQRHSQRLAVAYLDLDGFKQVNDQHGHDVGDQLLIAVANTMRRALRESDTLARIGGDEFVAVLAELNNTQDCEHSLQRLLAAAAQVVQLGDLSLQVSASLGVTFYPQEEAVDPDQLMRQADQAMYQAKLAGKNRYHVFDAVADSSVRGQHMRIEAIAQGLAAEQFELFGSSSISL